MTVLEIIILGTEILSLLSFLFFLLFIFIFVQKNQELKRLSKKRAKGPKGKRKLARKCKKIQLEKQKMSWLFISCFMFTLLFGGGSAGGSYYQSMALSKEDETAIVKGYFLVKDFKQQLELAGNKSESQEKSEGNLRYLASTISSYGAKKANVLNSEEGQLTLNRYYKAMQDIGTNAMHVSDDLYGNPEMVKNYQADLKRVEIYQEKVMKLYKVDKASLDKAKE